MCRGATSVLLSVAALMAAQPWSKDPQQWTVQDARHVLLDSPWSQPANAVFGTEPAPEDVPPAPLPGAAEAGVAGPRPNSGAGWDGGPGKNTRGQPPRLPVTVRWDSALPVRQALLRLPASDRESNDVYTPAQIERDYILTVTGLVPAGRYRSAGQLPTESASSSDEEGSKIDLQDPEPMLESLMGSSRLVMRDRLPIRPIFSLAGERERLRRRLGFLRYRRQASEHRLR